VQGLDRFGEMSALLQLIWSEALAAISRIDLLLLIERLSEGLPHASDE
jgi:hypothetical protein